jgi:hypothetical protein
MWLKSDKNPIFYRMTVARCVVASDNNSPQNHYNTFNILSTLLTVTYTSTTHTEHIVAFPLKKVVTRTLHNVTLFVYFLSRSIRCEQLCSLHFSKKIHLADGVHFVFDTENS